MRVFKTKECHKYMKKQNLSDSELIAAILELNRGQYDADLGAGVYKKRIAIGSRGKSAGLRTFVALKINRIGVFIYAFSKKEKDNVSDRELSALKQLAKTYYGFTEQELDYAVKIGELVEVLSEKINSRSRA